MVMPNEVFLIFQVKKSMLRFSMQVILKTRIAA